MNTYPKFNFATIFIFISLLSATNVQAQTQAHADLELIVATPHNNQVIPFGDSVRTSFFIINHGPDDIIGDTLLVSTDNPAMGGGFVGDIRVGDTGIAYSGLQWKDEGDTNNDTLSFCYYFRSPVSISNRVVDTNAANDTTCYTYVLLGDPTTGIATTHANKPLKLFPNPASGFVNIQLNTEGYHQLQLYVTDVLGREVLLHDYATKNSSRKRGIQFDVSGVLPGVYFVRLMADGQAFTAKLVVR